MNTEYSMLNAMNHGKKKEFEKRISTFNYSKCSEDEKRIKFFEDKHFIPVSLVQEKKEPKSAFTRNVKPLDDRMDIDESGVIGEENEAYS